MRQIGTGALLSIVLAGCGGSSAANAGAPEGSNGENIVIEMDDFTVPPGGEAYKCQNFTNPFGSVPVDVDRFEAHMPAGAHHMIVFFVDDITDGPLEDCSGSEFHPNVLGSQTPDGIVDLPKGVGVAMPPKSGLRYQLHFVNATGKEAVAGVTTTFHVAKPGSIMHHAGQFFFTNIDFTVPPGGPTDVTKTCSVPNPISILGASSHVHSHAIEFVATTAGTQLYENKLWSDPVPRRFDPPFELPANQDVTFTCTYMNETSRTIAFGESALTDEMCIFAGLYYPVEDVTSPNIVCL